MAVECAGKYVGGGALAVVEGAVGRDMDVLGVLLEANIRLSYPAEKQIVVPLRIFVGRRSCGSTVVASVEIRIGHRRLNMFLAFNCGLFLLWP